MSRFQFSVPRRRGPDDGWFRVGTFEVGTTIIVVLLGVLSFFIYAIDQSLLPQLALVSSEVRGGEVWRVLTWPFVAKPSLNAVIALAIFWYFGRDLERVMGRVRFTWYVLAIIVVPAVVATLLALVFSGLDGFAAGLQAVEIAVLVAYVARNPMARFFFGIPGWVIAAVVVGIDVLQYTGDRLWFALIVELLCIAVGLLLLRAMGHADEATWIPAIPGVRLDRPTRPAQKKKVKARRGEPRGEVVAGPWAGNVPDFVDQEEIDRLLDKVAATGLNSLTKEERQRLEAASRRKR